MNMFYCFKTTQRLKWHKKGFSLLEFVIYLAASACISLILSQWAAALISHRTKNRMQNSAQFSIVGCMDCFTKDIYQAPSEKASWFIIEKNKIGWKGQSKKIQYSFEKNFLYRTVSNLKPLKKHGSSKQIIMEDVIHASFQLQIIQGKVRAVTINCVIKRGDAMHEQKRTIPLAVW